jgi:hypothetical protein
MRPKEEVKDIPKRNSRALRNSFWALKEARSTVVQETRVSTSNKEREDLQRHDHVGVNRVVILVS